MADGGHLFVVHGRLECLVHDAAVVPVGQQLDFTDYWRPLVGDGPHEAPEHWAEAGWGRLPGSGRVWLVDVGEQVPDPMTLILERCTAVVAAVACEQPEPLGRRTRPLVAVPVLGIGGGGHGDDRGSVVDLLVERLTAAAQHHDVDVALVTPDAATHAAAQYARRTHTSPLPHELDEAARWLGRLARRGHLALLLGAGVSIPAGLPSWHELLDQLATQSPQLDPELMHRLPSTDQAALIEQVERDHFRPRVAELNSTAPRPSLLHALLAGLDVRQVATTNYDLLLESAVAAAGHPFDAVLPWASAQAAERWLLKLHGDVEHTDDIVLTRRHMVRYDASNRPSAAMLQSLLLTRHLLVVGASLTDDNVIRLAHEVQSYREEHHHEPAGTAFGSVLDADGDVARAQLWRDQLDWIDLSQAHPVPSTRTLELFLDRLALHAARTSTWVLDPRYAGLLRDDEERELAAAARALYGRLPHDGVDKWTPVRELLEELGAAAGAAG